jgi:hypothetical protein
MLLFCSLSCTRMYLIPEIVFKKYEQIGLKQNTDEHFEYQTSMYLYVRSVLMQTIVYKIITIMKITRYLCFNI